MPDQYAQCPCGSGKKLKWCCGPIMPRIDKVYELLRAGQEERAFQLLDELDREGINPPVVKLARITVLLRLNDLRRARELCKQLTQEHPDFVRGWESYATVCELAGLVEDALTYYREALARYPADAVTRRARVLQGIGNVHFQGQRFLAAWAHWQQAARLDPNDVKLHEFIDVAIRHNALIPNSVRSGGQLKSPDELAVFDDERRRKWDEAIERLADWQLNDLVDLFEYLTSDDRYDASAWYNLALARAWTGDSVRALEALEEYLKLEPQFEPAADAAHLGEVFRYAVDAEEYSDYTIISAVYQIEDPEALLDDLKASRRILGVRPIDNQSGPAVLILTDRPMERQAGPGTLVGARPRPLATITFFTEHHLRLSVWSYLNFPQVRQDFEDLVRSKKQRLSEALHQGASEHLDKEPFYAAAIENLQNGIEHLSEEALRKQLERYFEDFWLHRPLRSLGGLAPIDAAGNPKLRPRVEGIIRMHEVFCNYGGYDFERLRNKLGLVTLRTLDGSAAKPAEISAYSAAQLAELKPAELSVDDLLVGYQTANSLDAPTLALRFAAEMAQREEFANRLDMFPVFRRLITDALDNKKAERALEWLDLGQAYDEKHHGGRRRLDFDGLRARCHLVQGRTEEACALYRSVCHSDDENLERIAGAVETLLSAGEYPSAREFATLGLQKAESLRRSGQQAQFQEYLAAANAR